MLSHTLGAKITFFIFRIIVHPSMHAPGPKVLPLPYPLCPSPLRRLNRPGTAIFNGSYSSKYYILKFFQNAVFLHKFHWDEQLEASHNLIWIIMSAGHFPNLFDQNAFVNNLWSVYSRHLTYLKITVKIVYFHLILNSLGSLGKQNFSNFADSRRINPITPNLEISKKK